MRILKVFCLISLLCGVSLLAAKPALAPNDNKVALRIVKPIYMKIVKPGVKQVSAQEKKAISIKVSLKSK